MEDLLDLIKKDRDVIDSYLGNVSPESFKQDVLRLIKQNGEKELIKKAIEHLQSYL